MKIFPEYNLFNYISIYKDINLIKIFEVRYVLYMPNLIGN